MWEKREGKGEQEVERKRERVQCRGSQLPREVRSSLAMSGFSGSLVKCKVPVSLLARRLGPIRLAPGTPGRDRKFDWGA